MKSHVALLLCFLGGAAAAAPLERLGPAERPPEPCSLSVDFVSICCGPDRAMHDRVMRAVSADRGIKRAYSWPWGREGESTLCLVTRSKADTRRVVARFQAWVAAGPNPNLTRVWSGPKPHH
jgi:hypothetical protein